MENFRHAFDMDNYIFYTQIMQAETLAAAYRLWRRNWKGKGKEYTSGALVWQVSYLPVISIPRGMALMIDQRLLALRVMGHC